jgi:hypothetical protein
MNELDKIIDELGKGLFDAAKSAFKAEYIEGTSEKVLAEAKAEILKALEIAEVKARHDEQIRTKVSSVQRDEVVIHFPDKVISQPTRLQELESQIMELNDENRGCPHCKPENFPKMMTGIYGCPCSCHAPQEPQYELAYCPSCGVMTNHLKGICQKHKPQEPTLNILDPDFHIDAVICGCHDKRVKTPAPCYLCRTQKKDEQCYKCYKDKL